MIHVADAFLPKSRLAVLLDHFSQVEDPRDVQRDPASAAGRDRIVLLVLDGAGWHTEPGLAIPEGIRLVYLPPYTPELQPAEHLWPLVDEPIVNRHFETLGELDAILAKRCRTLGNDRNLIRGQAGFHWWPNAPTRSNHPEII